MCDVAAELDSIKAVIIKEVHKALKDPIPIRVADYTTVWKFFENKAAKKIQRLLKKHILMLTNTNFVRGIEGENKNRLADLGILCNEENTAISIKPARQSKNPQMTLELLGNIQKKRGCSMLLLTYG